MKVSLVSLPMSDMSAPPLGIAQIKGYLPDELKNDMKLFDLGIEFLDYCTDNSNLLQSLFLAKEYIRKNKDEIDQDIDKYRFFFECVLDGEYLCNNIRTALTKLKEKKTYEDWEKYKKYSSIVERTLKLFSAQYYPTIISHHMIVFPGDEYDSDNVFRMIDNRSINPLISFYNKYMGQFIYDDTQFLGISLCYSQQIVAALTLANIVKKKYPYIKIIVGGSAIAAYPNKKKIFKFLFKFFDGIIPYAGEEVWKEIIYKSSLESIPGCWLNEQNVFSDDTLQSIKRALPDFDDFDFNKYLSPEIVLPYILSVGCYWGKCTFCSYNSYKDNSIVKPSLKNLYQVVLNDFVTLKEKYGVKAFFIVDEAIPPIVAQELANSIYNNELPFHWYGEMRFEKCLDDIFISNLKKGGCELLLWGLESGNDRILTVMKKGTNVSLINKILKTCHNHKIKSMPMLFFGFPSETIYEARDTIQLLENNIKNIQYLGVGNFLLLQGSPVYLNPNDFQITIQKKQSALYYFDDYLIQVGITQGEAKQILNYLYNHELLKKFFDFTLLSWNHLMFLPIEMDNLEEKEILNMNNFFSLSKSCFFICNNYDWFNNVKSQQPMFYIYNSVNGEIYGVSRTLKEIIEKVAAGCTLKEQIAVLKKEIQQTVINNLKYLYQEGVIVGDKSKAET